MSGAATPRYVRKARLHGIADDDARREHAARLLLSGYDVESVAVLSGLTLDQVRAIADELAGEESTKL